MTSIRVTSAVTNFKLHLRIYKKKEINQLLGEKSFVEKLMNAKYTTFLFKMQSSLFGIQFYIQVVSGRQFITFMTFWSQ